MVFGGDEFDCLNLLLFKYSSFYIVVGLYELLVLLCLCLNKEIIYVFL